MVYYYYYGSLTNQMRLIYSINNQMRTKALRGGGSGSGSQI